jgi:hypothetical protein
MNGGWILEPLSHTVILGGGLAGALSLWISAKIEMRVFRKTFDAFRLSAEGEIRELRTKIEQLQAKPEPDPAPAPVMNVQSLNLTTRTKALRMHRRGEAIPSIAAALGAQQEEIDLLLKLDRMLEEPVR